MGGRLVSQRQKGQGPAVQDLPFLSFQRCPSQFDCLYSLGGNDLLQMCPAERNGVAVDPVFECKGCPGPVEENDQQRYAGDHAQKEKKLQPVDRAAQRPDDCQQVDQDKPKDGDSPLPPLGRRFGGEDHPATPVGGAKRAHSRSWGRERRSVRSSEMGVTLT